MDTSVLHALNGFLFHHDAVEDPVKVYESIAEALFLVMLIVAFLVAGAWTDGRRAVRRTVVAAGLSAGVALAIAQVLTHVYDRARPFVVDSSVHTFTSHAADSSFPSDHATAGFAIAVAILLRQRVWGLVVLAFAAVLAVGRVGLGVHYPSDVLAGAALGTLVALVMWAPPVRRLLDALADAVGGALDGAARALATRVRPVRG
jgi:undecaprenyl-diphosphatase